MKKLKYSLFILFAALAAACDDDKAATAEFALSTDRWSFENAEGRQRMIVSAPGAWTLTGVPDWMTVTPTEAEGPREITIAYTANETGATRTAALSVTCNGESLTIRIEQRE